MSKSTRFVAFVIAVLLVFSQTMPSLLAFGRYSGSDRYATAVENSKSGWESGADTVVIARGDNFADALAGVPLAFAHQAPILFTKPGQLPAVVKDEITRLGATTAYIIGKTAAVSQAVADEIAGMGLEIIRIGGANRYATAAAIASEVAPDGADSVFLAYGLNFPDALAAASYAAISGSPILLTAKDELPSETVAALAVLNPNKVFVIGGSAVISDTILDGLTNPERISGSDRYSTAVALAERFANAAPFMYVASGLDASGGADAITGAALAAKNGVGILLIGKSLPESVADYLGKYVYDAIILGGTSAISATLAQDVKDALRVDPVATITSVGSFGIHAGKVYAGYELTDSAGTQIPLIASNIASMTVLEPGAQEAKTLVVGDDSDPLLWFNVEKTAGTYKYTINTKAGTTYQATLTWQAPETALWVATGREGEHEGKTYVEYKLVAGEEQVSLKAGDVKLISSKDDAGNWQELVANTDETLWFNKVHVTGEYEFLVVTNNNTIYKATLDFEGPAIVNATQSKAYDTIQAAIDAANSGDTIVVGPGTYTEQLEIDKPLTLLGPNAAIAGAGERKAEAIISYPAGLEDNYLELLSINADNVTVSGFTFDDGEGYTETIDTNGICAHGNNISITNNILDGFNYVQILITSYVWNDETQNWDTEYIDGMLVEGNYGKNTLVYCSIYMQGASGIVRNNKVENAPGAIQIQPYSNPNAGTVENNDVNAYLVGIWYNYANKEAGTWTIKDNNITAAAYPYEGDKIWTGLRVQTFGQQGSAGAPAVYFENNNVNGEGATIPTRGLAMIPSIGVDATATFTGNTFANVDVGAYRGAGTLDLDTTLANNIFPEGSMVIGNQIIVPEAAVYNQTTGVKYDTIQAAINGASSGDTILIGPGTYKEAVSITVPNLTLRAWGEAVLENPTPGSGGIGISFQKNLGTVTVEGFTVKGFMDGIVQSMAAAEGTTVHVLNNVVYPDANNITKNGIQVSGDGSTIIGNTVFGAPYNEDYSSSAIHVVNAKNVTIRNNTIEGVADVGIAVSNWNAAITSDITVEGNQVSGAETAIYISGGITPTNQVSNVTVENNVLSGGSLEDKHYCGIYVGTVSLKNSEFNGNSFTDFDTHIGVSETDATLENVTADGVHLAKVVNQTQNYKGYNTIQAAIDAAIANDIIQVAPGEYTETLTIIKPLTIIGLSSDSNLPLIKGTVTISHDDVSCKNLHFQWGDSHVITLNKVKNITIQDCSFDGQNKFASNAIQLSSRCAQITLDNCLFKDGYYVTVNGYADDLTVSDCTIENCKSGINLIAGNNLKLTNTDISVIAQGTTNDTYCVRFANDSAISNGLSIVGGSFSVDKNNLVAEAGTYHSAIIIRKQATGLLKVKKVHIDGEVVNTCATELVATLNYWGQESGPSEGQVTGLVDYSPWYTNPEMTTISEL